MSDQGEQTPERQWRPIATAPKDGTVIRVREGEWAPCHVYWSHGRWEGIEYAFTRRPTEWMPR